MHHTVIRTVCQGCHCECGVLVTVNNGKIIKIDGDPNHPMNKGFICIKGRTYHERVYHPQRILYPLKHNKAEGKWERISWDQALHEIAEKLTAIRERYGAEAIATIHGTGPRAPKYALNLLACALGTPNRGDVDMHICYSPSLIAEYVTYGASVMQDAGPDFDNANCIVIWGANPLDAHPPLGYRVVRAKKERGAKLIVIDPRRTSLAKIADLWLQIRPGTDGALALSMLNVIIEEELYDKEFVERWCYGFDALKERIKKWSPEKVSDITWIPAKLIRDAAIMYATTKPATIHRRVAIEQSYNAIQTIRAIAILIAITGNLDVPGGNIIPVRIPGYVYTSELQGGSKRFRLPPDVENKRIGSDIFPLMSGPESVIPPFVHGPLLIDAILNGQIKALIVAGGNLINLPNIKKVWMALNKLELLIVIDFFMTPVGAIADYVLPATTWLERDECCDMMYTHYIAARQKVIEPLGEAWDDVKIVIELVKRLPWANREYVPWNNVEEFNDWRVKGLGISFREFKQKGIIYSSLEYRKYDKVGFKTPTGKVEIYSTIFEKYGYDPLPTYIELLELLPSKEYPYILITGSRHVAYFHSEGKNIESLRRIRPEPILEIHPQTAKELGIVDGDVVWIETPFNKNERIKMKAKITEDVHPKIVHADHAWWLPELGPPYYGIFDYNINVVIPDYIRGPICGSTPLRGIPCKIYKDL
ncbi:MAG: molybdopterin-dependent oxidoreductase [Ignisphaera sp.]